MHSLEAECPVCLVESKEGEESHLTSRIAIIAVSTILLGAGFLLEYYHANSLFFLPQLVYLQLLDYLSLILHTPLLPWEPLAVKLPFTLAATISGYQIVASGVTSLIKKKQVTINLLVTIAIVGSFAIGRLEEGASVAVLFMLVELLEEYAEGRAKTSVKKLIEAAPDTVTVLRDGKQVVIHAHSVSVGELVLIKPGEKIPLDGVVVEGATSVDQSSITGESIPVRKVVGDEVYAGTINNEGFIKVKVTKPASETFYSKMIRIIEEARGRKAPVERFINRFSRYYTPLVILIACVTAFIPPLLGEPLIPWLYRALTLLVISCPCALAISTPVTIISSITGAARKGILVKGAVFLEALSKIRAIAFDKTGTLTKGELKISKVIPLDDVSIEEILEAAASLEALSNHPIARAIVEKAMLEGVKLGTVEDFKFIPGVGVSGKVNGVLYTVGRPTLFQEAISSKLNVDSSVFIGSNGRLLGAIILEDELRREAYHCVEELKRRNLKTVIVSGDNQKTVEKVARLLGINEYYAELLPHDKVGIVKELDVAGGVAMVGDGVNDAPSIATATVGIAMGAIGSDAAIESADIILTEDNLSKIPYLLDLSRKTMATVKQNVSLSITIKLALVALAILGLVPLWVAILVGDIGLSLLVTLNALTTPRKVKFHTPTNTNDA